MLDDFERQHHIESLAGGGQRSRGRRPGSRSRARSPRRGRGPTAIASAPASMPVTANPSRAHRLGDRARRRSRYRARLSPSNGAARAASRPKPREQFAADEIEAHRVELMQRAEAARRVPPVSRLAANRSISSAVDRVADLAHAGARARSGWRHSPRSSMPSLHVPAARPATAICAIVRRDQAIAPGAPECSEGRAAHNESDMARIVQKFGGTSVADLERIRTPPAASSARSRPATRSRSSSRRWPAPPTSWSTGRAQIEPAARRARIRRRRRRRASR